MPDKRSRTIANVGSAVAPDTEPTEFDFRDRLIVVTGASSGIGYEVSRQAARAGARVVMIARRRRALAEAAAKIGPRALPMAADVASASAVDAVVATMESEHGVPDILVTAAGICVPSRLSDLSVADFEAHLQVNVTGSFAIARSIGLKMLGAGTGSIVFIASELAHLGARQYVSYCASKAAILGLTRAMALELAPQVRVNAVAPGPVDTPMLEAEFALFGDVERARREAIERVPMRRLASALEVAHAVLTLATIPYATGTILNLDGGTTIG